MRGASGSIVSLNPTIDPIQRPPAARNLGYGTQMMERAIERCFADPSVHAILLDPLAANTRVYRLQRERVPAAN